MQADVPVFGRKTEEYSMNVLQVLNVGLYILVSRSFSMSIVANANLKIVSEQEAGAER